MVDSPCWKCLSRILDWCSALWCSAVMFWPVGANSWKLIWMPRERQALLYSAILTWTKLLLTTEPTEQAGLDGIPSWVWSRTGSWSTQGFQVVGATSGVLHFYLESFLWGLFLFKAHQSATGAIAFVFRKYSGKIADDDLLWASWVWEHRLCCAARGKGKSLKPEAGCRRDNRFGERKLTLRNWQRDLKPHRKCNS